MATPIEMEESNNTEKEDGLHRTCSSDDVVIKKDLGIVTMVAVGFNICNSWAGLLASTQVALVQGGPATLVFGLIFSSILYVCIALSMAELASVYPTAGGQYHFSSVLSPSGCNRIISYVCGFLTVFSWVAIGSAVAMIFSQQVLAIAQFYNPSLSLHPWKYFVIYQAFGVFVLLYNILGLKRLPRTHDIGFLVTIGLFLVSVILFIVRPTEKASNEFVWTTFLNYTGWPDGVCFLSAQLTTCFIYAGLDGALHLAEDALNPRVVVPRATLTTISIGFGTAFAYTIAMLYSISDFEAILSLEGYFPFEMSRQAYRSDKIAVGLQVGGIVMAFFVLNAVTQTSSRITWSLARDNAIFKSRVLATIHPSLGIPVWSTVASWFMISLGGCVFLASSTAFSALLASCVILQQLSFAIPCALVLYQRRSEVYLPKNRSFRLPHWLGWFINGYVVVVTVVLTVFFVFPPYLPTTASNMNYSAAILAVVAGIATVNWYLYARRHYQGPRIQFQD